MDNLFQVIGNSCPSTNTYLFRRKWLLFIVLFYKLHNQMSFTFFHVSSAKRKLPLKRLGEDETDSLFHLVAVSSGCFVPGQQITRRMLFLKQWTANWVRPGGATTGACLQLPLTGQKISIGLANQKCSLLMMVDSS